jgi:hypothetical protein
VRPGVGRAGDGLVVGRVEWFQCGCYRIGLREFFMADGCGVNSTVRPDDPLTLAAVHLAFGRLSFSDRSGGNICFVAIEDRCPVFYGFLLHLSPPSRGLHLVDAVSSRNLLETLHAHSKSPLHPALLTQHSTPDYSPRLSRRFIKGTGFRTIYIKSRWQDVIGGLGFSAVDGSI